MLKLHHVGIATRDIARLAREYESAFGLKLTTPIMADAAQGVRVAFASGKDGSAVEFVQPLGPGSPIDEILEKGGGPYHVCFSVPDISQAVAAARSSGGIIVAPPSPAAAFGGKRVAFVYIGGNNLVELLES